MNDLGAQIMRRKAALQSARLLHESVWRDCFDYSFPERGDGFNGEKNDAAAKQAKQAKLRDSTTTDAGQILAASIMGGGTPSNSRWFGLSAGQDSDEEKRWFDQAAETIWENIHASNYDAVGFECCLDLVPAGWFVMYCDTQKEGGYKFEEWTLASCWIAASKPGGRPDTLIREYELTVEQAANDFGLESLSDKVQEMHRQGKLDEEIKFTHSIYPRTMHAVDAVRAKNLPFASVHIECDSKKMVRESGYHECPFWAPRWAKLSGSDYAVGPMFRALPDAKQLNRLVELEDLNFEMAACGTFIAEDDGVLNPRTVKMGPRRIIIANSVDSIKPLATGGKFELSFTKKDQLQAAIRKILMADQLSPQDGPVRTATEIHVRTQMIRQLLGPIYGRMQAEWYQPMIERCFGLAFRAGILGQPPESLRDKSFRVTFISPMAKSQKAEEVSAIEASLTSIGALAQAKQDPSVWDAVNVDKSVKRIIEGRGAPLDIANTEDEIKAIREQRAQAQQQAQQQQQQAELTQKIAPQLVKNAA